MRRVSLEVVLAPLCFAVSAAAFYAVLVLPLPKWRIAVLGVFGVGVFLAVVGGWLLGKLLWRSVRRGGVHIGAVVIGAAMMVVLVFSALSVLKGYPPVWHDLAGPIICSLTISLLVGSSYVVGFAILPGSGGASRRNRVLAVVFLYGSIGVGVFLQSAYPFPWGKIPPYPVRPPTRLTFEEFLSGFREKFPYEHRIEETPEGEIRIQYERPEIQEWPTEVHDDEFLAEGSRAVLPDGTVEVLGLDIYCLEPDFMHPDGNLRHIVPSEEDLERKRKWGGQNDGRLPFSEPVGFWRLDGTPVPEEEWPPGRRSWGKGFLVHGVFHMQTMGDIHCYEFAHGLPQVVLMPWETQVTTVHVFPDPFYDGWKRMVSLRFDAPIPGPLELRLSFVRSDEREYIFEGKEDDVIHLERNSLQLLRIRGGRFERQIRQGGLVFLPSEDAGARPGTTAVFMAALWPYWRPRLDIRAVTRDGSALEVPKLGYTHHFIMAEFDCRPEEIERFIFVERTHVTQIRFPVTDIPFFPRENRGLDNLLDMRFPYRVRDRSDIRRSLPEGRTGSGMPLFTVYTPMLDPLNASLREILNHHYAGGWWVEDGKIRFRKRRTLRSRLLEAICLEPPYPKPDLTAPIQY